MSQFLGSHSGVQPQPGPGLYLIKTWVVSHQEPRKQMTSQRVHDAHAPIANPSVRIGPAQVVRTDHAHHEANPNTSHVNLLGRKLGSNMVPALIADPWLFYLWFLFHLSCIDLLKNLAPWRFWCFALNSKWCFRPTLREEIIRWPLTGTNSNWRA